MRIELLEILRCPVSHLPLEIDRSSSAHKGISGKNHVDDGELVSSDGRCRYLIKGSIPRFVPQSNYADNFGMQWNYFSKTQLDSNSGHPISSDRFWKATGWLPEQLKDQWVLDVGCGSGRFAEVALNAGAKVVALDYSSAVDACYANLKHFPNLYVVQGDIYSLPFALESFQYVYSLGVLQHTPSVSEAFASLPAMVAPGGQLCVDYYWNRLFTVMHSKYLFRPITKRIPQDKLFALLKKTVPFMLSTSRVLGSLPILGRIFKRIVPVADYTGVYPLSEQQLREWALLDTFDMLSPTYDNPQKSKDIRLWMHEANFINVEVLHETLLVVRGQKPATTGVNKVLA
jgi:SAM-dependent methyltransferase